MGNKKSVIQETDLRLNLPRIFKEQFQWKHDAVDSGKTLQESDINLWKIQYNLVDGSLEWFELTKSDSSRKEKINGSTTQLRITNRVSVHIPNEYCITDAKGTFELCLDGSGLEDLTRCVRIDPSQPVSVITDRSVVLDVSFIDQGSFGEIQYDEYIYEVPFRCTLALTGWVTSAGPGTMQAMVQDIVMQPKSVNALHGLRSAELKADSLEWPIQGFLRFQREIPSRVGVY